MARRRKPKRKAPPGIEGFLSAIRRGDIQTVGILADYLDENGMPYAKQVRRAWNLYQRRVAYWSTADCTRRSFTSHEAVWWAGNRLRRTIASTFGRKWKAPVRQRFK